jgi:argininosuccinate synthase
VSGSTVAVATSGGLSSSWLIARLAREGSRVVAVTVDTGQLTEEEVALIGRRAKELGATKHVAVDARAEVWESHLTWLVKANVLSLAAERYVQARHAALVARQEGAVAVVHGSSAIGDEHLRFELGARATAPELAVRAPVRDEGLSRDDVRDRLAKLGLLDEARGRTAVEGGIFGGTTGGVALHDPWTEPQDEHFPLTTSPREAPDLSQEFELDFERGVPVRAFGAELDGVSLVRRLHDTGRRHGIGRHVRLADTAHGTKERRAVEAPALTILIEAHRELERLVLTSRQRVQKDQLALAYERLFDEGLFHEPAMRDLEALFESSQRDVTGTVRVVLYKGRCDVTGVTSPNALLENDAATGEDARGFARVSGTPTLLAARRARAQARKTPTGGR